MQGTEVSFKHHAPGSDVVFERLPGDWVVEPPSLVLLLWTRGRILAKMMEAGIHVR